MSFDVASLKDLAKQTTADAFAAGRHVAVGQVTTMSKAEGDDVADVDWDDWEPGDPAVASKLTDSPGLASMLSEAGVTIKGLDDTTLGRLATMLADAVGGGDSVDQIARQLREVVGDPARAYMIADTEVARAMTAASIDSYRANGVSKFNVLAEPDACEVCLDEVADNPHDLDDETVPYHPRCRCAVTPVVVIGGGNEEETGGEDEG